MLIAGGSSRAELYDPVAGLFRHPSGTLGTGRSFVTATLLPGGAVLIAGGYDARIRLTAGAWLFLPAG